MIAIQFASLLATIPLTKDVIFLEVTSNYKGMKWVHMLSSLEKPLV